jgi:hypothetical protein
MTDRTLKDLRAIVGGLSSPGKMPCHGYSLPAKECLTGSKLRQVSGSTCKGCYAMKGRYRFPSVEQAMYRRLESLSDPEWPEAMAELIRRKGEGFFRWHDSGDLQSTEHLASICQVAYLTPETQHWLPTREYRIVSEFLESGGTFPPNLNVRLSAHMIGGHTPSFPRLQGRVTISTVSRADGAYEGAHECPARHQDNTCGDCRACWTPSVGHVDYHLH